MIVSTPVKVTYMVLRVALGVVFIWASWEKILKPDEFAVVIDNYRLVPQSLIGGLALLLPWIEMLCGIALILGIYVKGSLVIVNLLLIVFTAALTANALRGIDVDCGCFSVAARTKGRVLWDIARDIAMMAVGFWLLFMQYRFSGQRSGPADLPIS